MSISNATDLSGPRSRQKAERTDLLLRQAARLFARKGFRGVSLEEIASEVGISGPALYRHFSNKVAILTAVLEDVSVRLLDGGRVRVAASASPGAALAALVDFHADFALEETDRIRVHNRDLATLPEEFAGPVRRAQRDYVELWVDQLVLLDEATAGTPDRSVARLKAQAAIGLLNSTPHSVRHGDPVAVKPVLVHMTLAALRS
ncbi:MAG: TetR/AcrR family transcriptional regulator [Cumulibacter sp.]